MSNTANTSLDEIKKAEESATAMITQAQSARDEKIAKKQLILQKTFLEADKETKEKTMLNLSQYKNKASDKGKQIVHDAKQEANRLEKSNDSKSEQASKQGLLAFNKSLGLN